MKNIYMDFSPLLEVKSLMQNDQKIITWFNTWCCSSYCRKGGPPRHGPHQLQKGNSWIVCAQLIFSYAVIQAQNSNMGMEKVVAAFGKVLAIQYKMIIKHNCVLCWLKPRLWYNSLFALPELVYSIIIIFWLLLKHIQTEKCKLSSKKMGVVGKSI